MKPLKLLPKLLLTLSLPEKLQTSDEQRLHEMYDVARNPEFYNLDECSAGILYIWQNSFTRNPKEDWRSGDGQETLLKTRNEMSESRMRKNLSLETRKKLSKATSGKNNSMYGKKHSPESLKKMSEAQSGENNPLYGKHHSAETRAKMSKPQTKITCPHCSKTGGDRNMKRYHFDNCKEISTIF